MQDEALIRIYAETTATIAMCFGILQEGSAHPLALGAATEAMEAADRAWLEWRRHYGLSGPPFPLDRLVILIYPKAYSLDPKL